MKLEKNDLPILLSTTEISDLFFTEYFSQSKGDYIKVYLYLVFISKYNKEVKLNDLSKKLSIPINFVELDKLKLFESPDIQKSEFVKSKFGIYGVCEPSALITAGFDSKLIYKKTSYNGVTIAIACEK